MLEFWMPENIVFIDKYIKVCVYNIKKNVLSIPL